MADYAYQRPAAATAFSTPDMTRKGAAPSPQPKNPQNLDDLPGVKAYMDEQDRKAGR